MTNREFFAAVASAENISAELAEFATAQINKMDAANLARREKIASGEIVRKVSPETIEKRNAIFGALTAEPQTSAQIGEVVGFSKNTVAGILRSYIANGEVIKGKVKMEGSDGKLHEYVTYSLPASSTEE